ncbi:MAG: YceI family protein [Niabella sp.]|nr:YceI family protein [Niabella sp.]
MKTGLFIISFLLLTVAAFSQKYFTKNGTVSFQAGTALEDIDATNKSAASVFDAATGQIEFAVLIRGFELRRALMQEHFNENYMESNKYPKATFKGKISNLQSISFQKPGSYPATVSGVLEIHGVKKQVTANGTLQVSGTSVQALAKFPVIINDYNIAIPGIVRDKISQTAVVTVNCTYTPLH